MRTKKIFLLIVSLLMLLNLHSQDVLLDMDVEDQFKETSGPNMQNYSHVYISLGVIPDFDEEGITSINFWKSGEYIIGYRYKRKLSSFYSLGYDVNFNVDRFLFDAVDLFSNLDNPRFGGQVKKHHLLNNSFNLEIYQRFNIGSHGNTLGNYIDMGVYGQLNHSVKEVKLLENKSESATAGKERRVYRKLDYIERLGYGLTGRIGHNKWAVYGKYRLSDFFSGEYNLPELPRLTVGIEFAIK